MASAIYRLAFEQPIHALEQRIAELEAAESKSPELATRSALSAASWPTRLAASTASSTPGKPCKSPAIPTGRCSPITSTSCSTSSSSSTATSFFGDDRALRTGFAKLDRYKVLVAGHHKGKTLKERNECFFGCAHPEGYRKAMAKMRLAAKYQAPDHLPDRHAGRVSRHRRRGARPGPSDRREHARNVAPRNADHLRRDRRRGLRRGTGHRRRRPRRRARVRLLQRDQPRRLCRHPLEEPRLRRRRRPRPEAHLAPPAHSSA